jgi:HK97 family phage portal protein
MSNRRRLGLGERLRAAASILTMGAVAAGGRYGPLVSSADWDRALDPLTDEHISPEDSLENSTQWACLALISDTVAALPLQVYQRDGERRTPRPDHPVSRLLNGGPVNDYSTRRTFIKAMEFQRSLRGAAFAEIERDADGRPVGLWPLDAAATYPKREDGRLIIQTSAGGETVKLDPANCIHLRGLSADGLHAFDPTHYGRQNLHAARAMERFGTDFFRNESKSGGFLLHPGNLSDQAKRNIVGSIQEQAREDGRKRGSRIKVLEEGMKFIETTIAPEDSQFNESAERQVAEIARRHRVPLVLIGAHERNTSWGTGIESLQIGFVTWTIAPLAESLEDEMTAKLLTADERSEGLYVRANVNALLRGDSASRAALYASGIQNGWLTRNEARAKEDLNPIEGGDVPLRPLNMEPSSDA